MLPRELRLGLRRRRTNHGGAFEFGILSGDKSESSGNGMDENRISLLDRVRFVHERKDGSGLHKRSSTSPGVDSGFGRDGVDLVPRDSDVLRIGAPKVLSG